MMIYFIQCGKNGPIKIGVSEDPIERLRQLQTANPYELKLLWVHDPKKLGDEITEQGLHAELEHENIRGEWFRPGKDVFEWMATCINETTVSLPGSNSSFEVFEHYGKKVDITIPPSGFRIELLKGVLVVEESKLLYGDGEDQKKEIRL